ncbi:hypothetical protein L195_g046139 [Trifolium pratense]|uniref:Uncharacterized protein n=1 Tax=Trifolium pratense TaxID=57577 RepID=A0A2K3MGV5_TRIPR|nr:hypothetical protein L195_g046139 [Trifolium pratense]
MFLVVRIVEDLAAVLERMRMRDVVMRIVSVVLERLWWKEDYSLEDDI